MIGARPHGRNDSRTNQRNGSRLAGVQLMTSDQHAGLKAAIESQTFGAP
jgi:hypothetical protein